VQFEITAAARDALQAWIKLAGLKSEAFLFPSRLHDSPHLGTRQYARILGAECRTIVGEQPPHGDAYAGEVRHCIAQEPHCVGCALIRMHAQVW